MIRKKYYAFLKQYALIIMVLSIFTLISRLTSKLYAILVQNNYLNNQYYFIIFLTTISFIVSINFLKTRYLFSRDSSLIHQFIKDFLLENEEKLFLLKQEAKNFDSFVENNFSIENKDNILFYLLAPKFTVIQFIVEHINEEYKEESLKIINGKKESAEYSVEEFKGFEKTYNNLNIKENLILYTILPSFIYLFFKKQSLIEYIFKIKNDIRKRLYK